MSIVANVARGIRNNNPLNIEHRESNKWLGLAVPPSDGRYCRFKSADYGIRAAALLLMAYQDRDGINTIAGIVRKWAPPSENNVNSYVTAVSSKMNVSPAQQLDLHDRHTMKQLIGAMAKHENGSTLDDTPLNKGLALAGYSAPTNIKSVLATPTMMAATTVAAPAAAVSAIAVIDTVMNNIDVIPSVVTTLGGPAAGGIALGVVTALTWGYNLYNRIRVRQETGV